MRPTPSAIARFTVRFTAAIALAWLERKPTPRTGWSDLRTTAVNDVVEIGVRWIDRPGEVGPSWSAKIVAAPSLTGITTPTVGCPFIAPASRHDQAHP